MTVSQCATGFAATDRTNLHHPCSRLLLPVHWLTARPNIVYVYPSAPQPYLPNPTRQIYQIRKDDKTSSSRHSRLLRCRLHSNSR